jgi:hypothetical protein
MLTNLNLLLEPTDSPAMYTKYSNNFWTDFTFATAAICCSLTSWIRFQQKCRLLETWIWRTFCNAWVLLILETHTRSCTLCSQDQPPIACYLEAFKKNADNDCGIAWTSVADEQPYNSYANYDAAAIASWVSIRRNPPPTSPSGIHLGHYCIAILKNNVPHLDTKLMNLPFTHGFLQNTGHTRWHRILKRCWQTFSTWIHVILLFSADNTLQSHMSTTCI